MFDADLEASVSREEANDCLLQSGVEGFTLIKFQVRSPLQTVSDNTKKALKCKFDQGVKAFYDALAKTLCSEQSMEELLQEAEKEETEEHSSISELKELINGTEDKNLKALLLSTMVNKFSFWELMRSFNVSRPIVQIAKTIASEKKFEEHNEKNARLKMSPCKVKHYISFMFDCGYIQDVASGTTTVLKLSNGKCIDIPLAVRTIQRQHIICVYQEYCRETGFQVLSESSLWNVLNTFHTNQRKAVRGLDVYTADGLNGFQALEEIVSSKIPEDLRKDYTNMLCNSKRYLKAQYIVSIADESNEVASHYKMLALSEVDDDGSFSEECEHFHNKYAMNARPC